MVEEVPSRRSHDSDTVIEGQKKALELALHGAPLADVLDVLARTVEAQSSNGVLASILLLDDERKHLLHGAGPHLPAAYNDAIHGIEIGPAVGSCGTAAYTGEVVVVSDIQSDPRWASFAALATEHGLRACWSMPIRSSQDEVLGTFALYHRTVAVPSDRDRAIVELLGSTAALVIERDLNARRRAAAEARLREEIDQQVARIGSLFAHAPAGIAVLRGPEHVYDVVNPRYAELIGGRDVLGKPIRAALPELEGQGIFELLDGVRRTGEPYVGRSLRVSLLRGPDHTPQDAYFDFVYQPIPAADGQPGDILVVAFEVTELVLSKLRAEASEQALKTFIDNLPELAWTAKPDGDIDYYNRRWYEYTGTTFEEMRGWGWEKVHDPELLPRVVERWKHSLATGEPFEMEFTLRGADGVRRWFLTRVTPVRDGSGQIVRWFGTNTNIDAIKSSIALTEAMAQQSRETQAALLELRDAKERAEARVAELERHRSS